MPPLKFQPTDLRDPGFLERTLRQFEREFTSLRSKVESDIGGLSKLVQSPTFADELAPEIRDRLQASGSAPINISNLPGGEQPVIVDTHANRLTVYPAVNYQPGTLFFETDRTVLYVVTTPSGSPVWSYAAGAYYAALASIPVDLGTLDVGFRFVNNNTDTNSEYFWTGTEFITIDYLQSILDAVTAAVTTVRVLQHLSTGTAAAGFGLRLLAQLEDAGGTTENASAMDTIWTNAGAATEASDLLFLLRTGGAALAEVLRLTGAGNVRLAVATGLLQLGGTSSSFPAFKRSAANTQSRLADDSATTDHEVADEAYDATNWNGSVEVPTKNAIRDKIVALFPTDPPAGVWTPTLTNTANIAASTPFEGQYLRVVNTVTFSGKVDIDPTAATTLTQLGISLPIASNFGATEDCAGTAFAADISQGAALYADTANDRIVLEYTTGADVANRSFYFSGSYQVI